MITINGVYNFIKTNDVQDNEQKCASLLSFLCDSSQLSTENISRVYKKGNNLYVETYISGKGVLTHITEQIRPIHGQRRNPEYLEWVAQFTHTYPLHTRNMPLDNMNFKEPEKAVRLPMAPISRKNLKLGAENPPIFYRLTVADRTISELFALLNAQNSTPSIWKLHNLQSYIDNCFLYLTGAGVWLIFKDSVSEFRYKLGTAVHPSADYKPVYYRFINPEAIRLFLKTQTETPAILGLHAKSGCLEVDFGFQCFISITKVFAFAESPILSSYAKQENLAATSDRIYFLAGTKRKSGAQHFYAAGNFVSLTGKKLLHIIYSVSRSPVEESIRGICRLLRVKKSYNLFCLGNTFKNVDEPRLLSWWIERSVNNGYNGGDASAEGIGRANLHFLHSPHKCFYFRKYNCGDRGRKIYDNILLIQFPHMHLYINLKSTNNRHAKQVKHTGVQE